MWIKTCRRPGCGGIVRALNCSALASRAYCEAACRRLDASRAHRSRYVPPRSPTASEDVPSPSNNVRHRRIRDQQLALIAQELERIRLERKRPA